MFAGSSFRGTCSTSTHAGGKTEESASAVHEWRKTDMSGYRKLSRTSSQRKALLRSQVTALLYHGRIITTEAKAKATRKIVDGLIALAVKERDNYEVYSDNDKSTEDQYAITADDIENLPSEISKTFNIEDDDIQTLEKMFRL